MARLADNTDLYALFGVEMDAGADVAVAATAASLTCTKCHGRGNFIGYTGRVVGKCFACDGSGLRPDATKPAAGVEISVAAIAQSFAAAHSNGIKRPKLRLATFIFSRAPDHGKNAGSIYVKEADTYLGKVTDGQFRPVRECDDATRDRIVEVAADPASAAKAYGMKYGTCSCCGRDLTNAESIELGIGPICRDKFGW